MDVLLRETQVEIIDGVQEFWTSRINDAEFDATTQGKEIGHGLAGRVEELTTEVLAGSFNCMFECDEKGVRKSRAFGDTWVRSSDVFNPINVKTGVRGHEGRPNICSLKRLARALASRATDSYWLLFVKVAITDEGRSAEVDLVNLLDWLDFVSFDSGPGQLMLAADRFYAARAAGVVAKPRTVAQALEWLQKTLEDADARLVRNRRDSREALFTLIETYEPASALAQAPLSLV